MSGFYSIGRVRTKAEYADSALRQEDTHPHRFGFIWLVILILLRAIYDLIFYYCFGAIVYRFILISEYAKAKHFEKSTGG